MQEKVTTLEISLKEETAQVKSKKCAVITQALLNRIEIFQALETENDIYYLIKSLILAQDERWRHA